MQHKYKWKTRTIDNIWYRVHGIALQSLKQSARQITQNFIFDYWACNKREAKICNYRTPQCETCIHKIETFTHLLQCADPKRRSWSEMIEKVKVYFKKRKAPQGVQLSWGLRKQPLNLETIYLNASYMLVKPYREQHIIRWDHFIRGRLHKP